ncbi:MAG: hypothetical protein ABW321_16230 [Polyangiales bacterium]
MCKAVSFIRGSTWWLGLAVSLLGLASTQAEAQSCHAASLRPTDGLTYRVAASAVLGSYDTAAVSGEYQGLFLTATLSHPWFTAEVALPGYRMAETGRHAYGLGDVLVSARGNLYRSTDQHWLAGPELAATLPSGRAEDGLGMGHVMLMPGGFVQWRHAGFAVITQLAYGRALGSMDHAAHGDGPFPIVNPMNRSELTHAIGVSATVHPNLHVTGRLLGAVTLFDHAGAAREIVAPGLQFIAGAFDAALEIQLPVVGNPFSSRTVASIGAQW